MPIVSDIGSMGTFLLNLVQTMLERPIIFIAFILTILFFPLNVLDLVLYVVVNFFILIVNLIMFLLLIPVYIVLGAIYTAINLMITFIASPINWILTSLGLNAWNPLTLYPPNVTPPWIPYMTIDIFATNDTIIGLIINNLGLSFPLFSVRYPNELIKLLKMKVY